VERDGAYYLNFFDEKMGEYLDILSGITIYHEIIIRVKTRTILNVEYILIVEVGSHVNDIIIQCKKMNGVVRTIMYSNGMITLR
jgi:hypothetical protein